MLITLVPAVTAEPRRILLQDGTEIVGEIVSMTNGSYTIRSRTLGTLTISDRQVRQISSVNEAPSDHASRPVDSGKTALQSSQVQAIQQQLTSDSAMIQQIMALQSSPEMQAVLSDPEVMAAVQRLDFEALASHPKIRRLMNTQGIQSITRQTNP